MFVRSDDPTRDRRINSPLKIIFFVVLALLLLLWAKSCVTGCVNAVNQVTAPSRVPDIVTKAEYNQIEHGMHYTKVAAIIGHNGEEISSNEIEGVAGYTPTIRTVMLQWVNGDGTSMNAIFQNGELVQKAQFGLE